MSFTDRTDAGFEGRSGAEWEKGSAASIYEAIRRKVIAIVKDDSGKLTKLPDDERLDADGNVDVPDDYDDKINAALNRYSKYRPHVIVTDLVSEGSRDLTLPADWSEGFSVIVSIEYPIDQNPEAILDPEDWKLYQTPHGTVIRLATAADENDAVRVSFTIPRIAATLPVIDIDAFCNLAASLCLEDLANAFAQSGDSTISADVVNYRTKSSEFSARAKRLLQLYKEHMGIKDNDTTTPASCVADLDMKYPGGSERLTHPRWQRRRR